LRAVKGITPTLACLADVRLPDGSSRPRGCGKQTGLRNLPFRDFAANEVWLELVLMATDLMAWTRHLLLPAGAARSWEPKRLCYCLLHVAGRLCRSGRRLHLRLQRGRRWVDLLVIAFSRLRALPRIQNVAVVSQSPRGASVVSCHRG
jgi:hypothetical protein